jgi:hypothetical protein
VSGQNIYDPVEKRVQRVFPVFKGSDFTPAGENFKQDTLKIVLESPMRIKFGGQFRKHITFEMMAVNLLRRVQLLSAFYCGGPDLVDLSVLIDKSRQVKKAGENIFWQHQDRFSFRQDKNISMGGVSGWIEFAGDVGEFIPFLKIAEYLHIGKGTGLGLGKIGVDVLR